MNRRRFMGALLGSTIAYRTIGTRGQQSVKPLVGTLGFAPIPPSVAQAFEQGILPFYSGELVLEHRDAGGRPELFPERAADLARLKVNVVFARGPEALAAARNAMTSIPIVAVDLESDPVAMGFVNNLARPGGNVTGVFLDLPELSGKQMELLKEVFPRMTRVAIIGNRDINAPQFTATETAARAFSVQPETIELRVSGDLDSALETARTTQTDAGILLSSPLVFGQLRQIAELALAKRLPIISLFAEFPRAGGLMAYGPSLPEAFRKCGNYVGKILQGAKPSDLPIERPERFELAINLKTAKALGLDVPIHLQQLADEVIE